jgi:two-component system, cell cycle response regulator DivK
VPTVLIVDDFADARDLMTLVLTDAGYDVLTAIDGRDALRVARAEHPDLVLMDILMPVMDGVEATRRFKADPALARTPVIAYTADPIRLPDPSGLFEAVCVKPCSPDDVVRTVEGVTLAARTRQS